MLGAGEGTGADVGGIGRHRALDGGAEFAVALDEFRHPRREHEHVLEHQDLAVAGRAAADPDGGDRGPQSASSRPCARNDPIVLIDCGVRPIWPITGTPRSTRKAIVSAIRRPPSTLMAPQPVSFITRAAEWKACSLDAS